MSGLSFPTFTSSETVIVSKKSYISLFFRTAVNKSIELLVARPIFILEAFKCDRNVYY